MNRPDLFRVVDLAHAVAHSATLSASYSGISKERAEHFARLAEEGLYEALEALFEARLGPARSDTPAKAQEVLAPVMEIAA